MFLPPLTTLVTRLMATTWSLSWRLPTSNFGLVASNFTSPGLKPHCSNLFPQLELQSGLAGGIGQSLHPAVIQISATIEDHFGHALGLGALGDGFAHRFCRRQVSAGSLLLAFFLAFIGGGGHQRLALHVIHQLGVNMVQRAINIQARALAGTHHLFANALVDARTDCVFRDLRNHKEPVSSFSFLVSRSNHPSLELYLAPVLPTFFFRRSPA